MKSRFWIYATLLLLVVLAVSFWRRPMNQPTNPERPQQRGESVNTSKDTTNPGSHAAPSRSEQTFIPSPAMPQQAEDERTREEEYWRGLEESNVPIDFHGRVIDQDRNALSGVVLKVVVRHWAVAIPGAPPPDLGQYSFERVTGPDGRFEINGVTGDAFDLGSIKKDGYEASPRTLRSYGPSSGSFDNPVIFKMWREGAKEHLIAGSHVFGIDSGKAYTLNLITGKKIVGQAEGDLLVSITRPSEAKPRENFPWSFSIKAIGGGLVQADPDDDFMYYAPQSGYQPTIEWHFGSGDAAWAGTAKGRFFIRSRDGQVYGRAQVEIYPIYNVHSAIEIDYAVNPNGSRNLEQ